MYSVLVYRYILVVLLWLILPLTVRLKAPSAELGQQFNHSVLELA